MNNKPKPSGDHSQSRGSKQNSQGFGQSQKQNGNNNNNNSRNNNNNKRRNNYNNGANNNNFEYVRKVDTLEGQEEMRRKQLQQEEEERNRQELIRQKQLEEEERQRQMEIERAREQERLEQLEQLQLYIKEEIVLTICADAEQHALQRKYLKSFEGLSYLLSTNFADFEDAATTNIPFEVEAFKAREYVAVPQEVNSNFRRRHQTSYNNTQKYDDQSSPKQQGNGYNNNNYPQGQRMTVKQRLNNFSNNKNQYNSSQNGNNQRNNANMNDQNGRNQHPRHKNLTAYQQNQMIDEESDSKWRHTRAPLFSQQNNELKFLLNVLTPDNFNNLKDQFFQLCSKDVDSCINSLINKVCKEAKYTKLYAQLAIYVKDCEEDGERSNKTTPSNPSESKSFKTQMFSILQDFFYDQKKLNSILCSGQQSFKNGDEEDEEKIENGDGSSTSQKETVERKRFQIFLKFLGELFLSKFLPKKIISYIIQTMIQQYIIGGLKAEDKNLEGIISLIDSIGLDFENSWKNSPSRQISIDLSFFSQIRNQFLPNSQMNTNMKLDTDLFENQFISFDGIMKILVFLNSTDRVTIRIRSLITNLNHRWNNKWEKALHQKEDPRTLQELHRQHYDELNKRQQEVQEHFSNQKSPIKLSKQTSNRNRNTTQSIDYTKEVKRIFADLDKTPSDIDECISELTKLGISNILQSLFSSFFDTRLENLQIRYQLMNSILRETHSFQKQTFLQALNYVMNSLYSQACDFPHLNESFVTILCPLIMTGYLELSALQATPCGDPDEDEDKNYFFQEFKNDCSSFLKSVNYFMCED